jgi:hypothetical protein
MKSFSLAIAGCACAALAAPSQATTRSSFKEIDALSQVTAITSNAGRTYTVSVGATPTFTLDSMTYSITDVFGFYLLSDDADFSPLPALGSFGPSNAFSDDSSNSGPGAIAGWKSNPNKGLVPGNALAFTLPSNFPIADIDRLGFHVRINGTYPGTKGNTGNITLRDSPSVPAPGACALFGAAGLMAWRRRRSG